MPGTRYKEHTGNLYVPVVACIPVPGSTSYSVPGTRYSSLWSKTIASIRCYIHTVVKFLRRLNCHDVRHALVTDPCVQYREK